MSEQDEWFEKFPPVKAPSAYDGSYTPKHMRRRRLQDDYSMAVGAGVVAVIVLGLLFIYLFASVVMG